MRAVTFAAPLLVLWACGALAQEPPHDDVAAGRALGLLVSLEEGPKALTQVCKSVDPSGAKARQTVYKDWRRGHQPLFDKIDQYARDILPALFPSVNKGNVDATAAFRNKQTTAAQQEISALDPQSRQKVCQNFPNAAFFNDERTAGMTKAAFDVLDAWKKERGQGAA